MTIFDNIGIKTKGDIAPKIIKAIEDGYSHMRRPNGIVKKNSFSPSAVGYAHNRCFSGDTEFVTDLGVKTMREMVGKKVNVWTGSGAWGKGSTDFKPGRGWKEATVESFGIHPLMKITVTRNGIDREVYSTADHRWIVSSTIKPTSSSRVRPVIKTTSELVPGNVMCNSGGGNGSKPIISPDGVRAGIVFGDGTVASQRRSPAVVKLYGAKDASLVKFFNEYQISETKTEPLRENHPIGNNQESFVVVYGLPRHYKGLPMLSEHSGYLWGWLSGYFAADGSITEGGAPVVESHNASAINAVRDICEILRISHGVVRHKVVNKMGRDYDTYSISMRLADLPDEFFLIEAHRKAVKSMRGATSRDNNHWIVKSVEQTDRVEEVFCVVQPETERFALADGLLTMNCPRLWVMKFSGRYEENDTTSLQSLAVMSGGTATHERIQTALEKSGVVRELEQEIKNEDPPIRGFIDVVANFDDMDDESSDIILELKTTRDEAFRSRAVTMRPPAYQMYQILIYLYLKNLKHGALVYENTNDKRLLVIPVEMTDDNRLAVENVFDWMRKVWAAHKAGQMPYRPWKQTSPNCADCPLFEACWDEPREDVKIKSMAVHKW